MLPERLNSLFAEDDREKLTAQAYDRASMMRGEQAGVQKKVHAHFKNAHYVHCYAQKLNLIMQLTTSHVPAVRVLFWTCGTCGVLPLFFLTWSPKRTSILDQIVDRRLPKGSSTRWNCAWEPWWPHAVFWIHQDIRFIWQHHSEGGIWLSEHAAGWGFPVCFCFFVFLQLFHLTMLNIDVLHQQLQKKDTDAVLIKRALQSFTSSVQATIWDKHVLGGLS